MTDFGVFMEWLSFAARWLHVVTAIAWIGSSFYFIALDLGLTKSEHLPPLASGEEWQVHGGGFYHITKYMVAPEFLPEHLTWFKWESYFTWISGFILLAIVYYYGADLFLINRYVLDVPVWGAIAISMGSIALGWVVYDLLCRSPIGRSTTGLMVVLFIVITFMGWAYTHLFTGRAAMLHIGIFTATIMVANVAMVIIPNQKIVVADLKAGRTPDPKYGRIAKQRSLHNNYLTLPVIFFMLSNHYPLAFATRYNWVIGALIFLVGVLIRHYFNTKNARKGSPHWTWFGAVVIFLAICWLSEAPAIGQQEQENMTRVSRAAEPFLHSPHFKAVTDVIEGRCAMCHTKNPNWPGVMGPPLNIILDNPAGIATHGTQIAMEAGFSHAMPPGNVSAITPKERALIVQWYREAQAGPVPQLPATKVPTP